MALAFGDAPRNGGVHRLLRPHVTSLTNALASRHASCNLDGLGTNLLSTEQWLTRWLRRLTKAAVRGKQQRTRVQERGAQPVAVESSPPVQPRSGGRESGTQVRKQEVDTQEPSLGT